MWGLMVKVFAVGNAQCQVNKKGFKMRIFQTNGYKVSV
jgi:hypothetical protein